MGEREIETFLSSQAIQGKVSALTQNQTFNALLFLYRHVLRKELEESIQAVRAKRPQRLHTVNPKATYLNRSFLPTLLHSGHPAGV